VSYVSATKVLLVFENPFWERENGKKMGGATFTDLNIKQIFYPEQSLNSSKFFHKTNATFKSIGQLLWEVRLNVFFRGATILMSSFDLYRSQRLAGDLAPFFFSFKKLYFYLKIYLFAV